MPTNATDTVHPLAEWLDPFTRRHVELHVEVTGNDYESVAVFSAVGTFEWRPTQDGLRLQVGAAAVRVQDFGDEFDGELRPPTVTRPGSLDVKGELAGGQLAVVHLWAPQLSAS